MSGNTSKFTVRNDASIASVLEVTGGAIVLIVLLSHFKLGIYMNLQNAINRKCYNVKYYTPRIVCTLKPNALKMYEILILISY